MRKYSELTKDEIKKDIIPSDFCSMCLNTGSYVVLPYYKRKKCNHKVNAKTDKWLRSSGLKQRCGML